MKTDREIELLWQEKNASNNFENRDGFIDGYKQAQKELYSEKEVLELLLNCPYEFKENIKEWFNQNKKKQNETHHQHNN